MNLLRRTDTVSVRLALRFSLYHPFEFDLKTPDTSYQPPERRWDVNYQHLGGHRERSSLDEATRFVKTASTPVMVSVINEMKLYHSNPYDYVATFGLLIDDFASVTPLMISAFNFSLTAMNAGNYLRTAGGTTPAERYFDMASQVPPELQQYLSMLSSGTMPSTVSIPRGYTDPLINAIILHDHMLQTRGTGDQTTQGEILDEIKRGENLRTAITPYLTVGLVGLGSIAATGEIDVLSSLFTIALGVYNVYAWNRSRRQ
jgi:hypothetical protein